MKHWAIKRTICRSLPRQLGSLDCRNSKMLELVTQLQQRILHELLVRFTSSDGIKHMTAWMKALIRKMGKRGAADSGFDAYISTFHGR